ncbi:hypothetical protein HF324_12020 [Chitinophaga oryzae]|uniref:Uncharacterized protein n=1 Tax=Chitinophaga oryzae TaxID=2725414 RepID=A0ABX6LEK3_9BACT|nr:hypothetical protein [Chitinophaga oryzae]QJB38549.1 hypothetical protein HF324_12020 [Chitinophaga oryzae]
MIPSIQKYPQFEANQILTNEQLNLLFGYNDEQTRLTRSHLIGIGIICGLDVITAADGKSVTITKGVGVTSAGYLVVQETDLVYAASQNYVLPKEVAYPVLQNNAGANLYPLWQLLPQIPISNPDPSARNLDIPFLQDKVVMLFVELNKTGNKNCLPNSCDDKGSTVGVTIQPLLIRKSDADKIKAVIPGYPNLAALPDIRMPRFDVAKTALNTTPDVIKAYKIILTKAFIDKVLANLKKLSDTFAFLNSNATALGNLIQNNTIFSYDNDSTIKLPVEYYYQYYFDFVSDLVDTYNEIKNRSGAVLATCCPDPAWFPRHLFLKEAVNPPSPSAYRHYFLPSPAVAREGQRTEEIVLLLNRLYMMLLTFPKIAAPTIIAGGGVSNSDLRVTPSYLGSALSGKAIPHYYSEDKQSNNRQLFEYWNYRLTKAGKANQNLSYRAIEYPATEDFVKNPLRYDIEPYNFFRIEGHVGKHYKSVVNYLQGIVNNNRLPFDIVAVKTGNKPDALTGNTFEAQFADLESAFLLIQADIICKGGTHPTIEAFKKLTKLSQLNDPVPPNNQTMLVMLKALTIGGIPCDVSELVKLLDIYSNRMTKLQQQFLLSNYAEKHAGLQHKAGVPTGGTFVIVYHGEVVTTSQPGKYFGDLIYLDAVTNKYKLDEQAFKFYQPDAGTASVISTLLGQVDANDPQAGEFIEKTFQPMLGKYKAGARRPPFGRGAVAGFATGVPVSISEGIVFADFYLPYQCCGDGTTVQYTINESTQPLGVDITGSECKDGQQVVHFLVTGGTPPYKANNNSVNSRFDLQFGSNQPGTVVVTDSKGGSVTVQVPAKTCEPPCDLPCKGLVTRCLYPVWMVLPEQKVFPAKLIRLEVAYLTITDENGMILMDEQFVKDITDYLQQTGGIKNANYHDFMKAVTEIINKRIDKVAKGSLKIEYVVKDAKLSGQFMITSFPCQSFDLRIRMDIDGYYYDYRYTKTGVDAQLAIRNQNSYQTRMPKYGCSIDDQCKGVNIQKPCTNDSLEIKRETDTFYFVTGDYKAIYWIAEGGIPGFGTGSEFHLDSVDLLPEKIRAIAIDKNGCWAYAEFLVKRA